MPHCGSVRFIVPVHSPLTIFGTYSAFCSVLPWVKSAAMAPWLRPGYMANAMFDDARNSLTIWVRAAGRPRPPNSGGAEMPIQPPSTSRWKASLKPSGVVTLPSLLRRQPCRSPTLLRGTSTFSQNLATSLSIASTTSGEASANPGRFAKRSMWKTSLSRNSASSTGAL